MRKISIIGDNFMLPTVFEEKIRQVCEAEMDIRTLTQDWPDVPMEHGYAEPLMDNLKEYLGDPEEIVDFIGDAEILVTHLAPISKSMLEKLSSLKMIAVSRGGPVNIDMSAAKDAGVRVVNTPGRNASAVAEFTLGGILSETRMIRSGHEALRRGEWRGDLYRADTTGRELSEMTIGVVGYGDIGKRVVKLLKAFNARVIVHDPYVQLSVEDINSGVEQVSFDGLLEESDLVTLHARVTEETTRMMNADTFGKMKKGSILVNTARGPLVDYDALHESLVTEHLSAAMIETFAVEPVPSDSPFLQLPNVTLTPHIAGASVKTVSYAAENIAIEVNRYLTGKGPINSK